MPLQNSWVIIRKETGKAVAEVYDKRTVDRLNTDLYEAKRPIDYLPTLNNKGE